MISQVIVQDINTQFIEHIIFIMKNVLEKKMEQPSESLGSTSIEGMMLAIVRCVILTSFINIVLKIWDTCINSLSG